MQVFPDRETFGRLASEGNLIPVTCRLLADLETPLSAYRKLRGGRESFLLESVEGGEHLGRYSFVGTDPRVVIRQTGQEVAVWEGGHRTGTWEVVGARGRAGPGQVRDGLAVVEQVMSRYRPVRVPGLPRFIGGAVGYVGYEFIHDIEPVVPRPGRDELGTPTLYLFVADRLVIFDRVTQTLTLLVNAWVENPRAASAAYDRALDELRGLLTLLDRDMPPLPAMLPEAVPSVPFVSNMSRETFLELVRRARQYITAGDVIQVVGSQRFAASVHASALEVYRALRSINPSPYLFLLELDGFALVGASPEIHVRCEDRRVEIRPIAGTRRRGRTPEEDAALEAELLADPKERAEHVMLVDLARNDLGRVCEYGSVKVRDLMVIERYSHVMHIVSSVEGRLAEGRTSFDLMRATFPAGTVSGAPKVRAMQIISELEGTARGPYAGCVGYFGFDGNLDTCITIRTAVLKGGVAYVQAGGGWVHDSDPGAEYQETVNKASAMFQAVALAEHFAQGTPREDRAIE
ncbi:MAG: anthranilate synthase component I [Verrucomicrobiota bacterium]|nr:anthranilate synthase component I [Limisphaera sp.]MDW8381736.1 anthranilate synthase component I [Verrucomicrobiota bacterium]